MESVILKKYTKFRIYVKFYTAKKTTYVWNTYVRIGKNISEKLLENFINNVDLRIDKRKTCLYYSL